jgi:hypothetical protein
MPPFWRNWLNVWCGGVALFGVVLAGGAFPATSAPCEALLDLLNGAAALDMEPPLRFAMALLGAVTLGWSLTLRVAIGAADALGPRGRPVWAGLTTAVIVWYVADSALSVATGFALNAVSNTLVAALFLLPVLRSGVLGGEAGGRALA